MRSGGRFRRARCRLDPGLDAVLAEQIAEPGDLEAQPPVLVRRRGRFAPPAMPRAARAELGQHGGQRAADLALPRAEPGQHLRRGVVSRVEEGQQDVLGADVVVAVDDRLAHGSRHDPHGKRDLGAVRDLRPTLAGEPE